MTQRTKQIIIFVALLQLILTIALFAFPQMVRALPGTYLVRLQNNQLTSGIIELVITPIAAELPAPAGQTAQLSPDQLPNIPGLTEPTPTPLPQPTATSEPTATPQPTATDISLPTASPTSPPSPTPTLTPTPTTEPLPESVVLEGLTTVRQGFNNCGPANMTIVLNYYGDPTTQEDAAAYLKPNDEDRNVSPWQISDYVNQFTTLRAIARSGGNLEMVKQFIAAGFPVVIEKGYEPGTAEGWYGHYLTIYGYDDVAQEFYSRDTYLGPFTGAPRKDNYDEFNMWWQQFNYTFYVVYRPEQETQVNALIPSQLLDDRAMWEFTAQLANEEIRSDPENAFAWFNLGVSLTRIGELTGENQFYQNGATAFDQARTIGLPPRTLYYEHRPFMAYWKIGRLDDVLDLVDAMLATPGGQYVEEIFWFQGHALAGQGDLLGAKAAYEQALEVNPNFYYAQVSLDWVNGLLGGN